MIDAMKESTRLDKTIQMVDLIKESKIGMY